MYLTELRLIDVVKKQFRFKLNAYTGVFTSLIIMQLIGIFLSFESSSGGMSGSEPLMITWSTSMNETPIVFTWVWAFSMGILMTTIAHRNDAFTFVSNRLSHHLASILFLLLIASIGGITASLSGSLIKLITIIQNNSVIIESVGVFDSPYDFCIRILTSILYTVLFAGFGYMVGAFIQRSKLVIPLIFVAIFIVPYWQLSTDDSGGFLLDTVLFYGAETLFLLFLLKVLGTLAVFFAISIAVTNKMEVRK